MQQYVANIGITASALRNLGDKGFVKAARDFLANLDLKPLITLESSVYENWLVVQTEALRVKFPKDHPWWGPARKSVNIFMTIATLNRFLCDAYALERLEYVLEVPLDSVVAGKLRKFARERTMFPECEFPKWTTIKALEPTNSTKFQTIAAAMAKERGIPRGRLDVALWEPVTQSPEQPIMTLVSRLTPRDQGAFQSVYHRPTIKASPRPLTTLRGLYLARPLNASNIIDHPSASPEAP